MQHPQISAPHLLAPEERAFFLQLTALNVALEAARAGPPSREIAKPAVAIEDMLNRYFFALTEQASPTQQTP